MKKYTEEELIKRREYYRLWRIKHGERLKEYNRQLQLKHRDKILAKAKIRYHEEKTHRDTSKFFKDRDDKRFLNKIKALQKVSNKNIPDCCICGEKDPRVLTINHINGKGSKEISNYGNMAVSVNRGRDTNDLDVRCFNCNILYEFDRGKRGPSNWRELYNNLLFIKS